MNSGLNFPNRQERLSDVFRGIQITEVLKDKLLKFLPISRGLKAAFQADHSNKAKLFQVLLQ